MVLVRKGMKDGWRRGMVGRGRDVELACVVGLRTIVGVLATDFPVVLFVLRIPPVFLSPPPPPLLSLQ